MIWQQQQGWVKRIRVAKANSLTKKITTGLLKTTFSHDNSCLASTFASPLVSPRMSIPHSMTRGRLLILSMTVSTHKALSPYSQRTLILLLAHPIEHNKSPSSSTQQILIQGFVAFSSSTLWIFLWASRIFILDSCHMQIFEVHSYQKVMNPPCWGGSRGSEAKLEGTLYPASKKTSMIFVPS